MRIRTRLQKVARQHLLPGETVPLVNEVHHRVLQSLERGWKNQEWYKG